MKKTLLFTLFLCTVSVTAQRKPKIKGNRSLTEVREALPAFNAIELNDDLEITLQKASAPGYAITADDNLIDVLKFKVEDHTLIISSFYKITAKKKLEIIIEYEDLVSLTLHDGKMAMSDILSTDELFVNTFGTSRLQLNTKAPILHINMEGNSSGDFNLDSDSLEISLKDRADARIYSVGEKNKVQMFKNASARMEGTTDTLTLNIYGDAGLKAERLEAATAVVTLEDSPEVRVYAFKSFELSSKGSARTYLYGNPEITIHEFQDTSEIFKRND